MITIEKLRREYDSFVAVDDLSLEIPDGQFTVLLGPSGSGKTTVLRMLNRMVIPTSGTVRLDGEDLSLRKAEQLRRTMGYVIQSTGLFPNMTVRRNIAAVPRLLGWDKARTNNRVDEMLELVGLDPATYAQKLPWQLSGGEAQRVGVARALAADPPIILMDEPFGAVDPVTRTRLQLELRNLHQKLKKTIVFVTHDIDEAVLLADKIALLKNGKLQQYDTAEGFWKRPANDFVREFFGRDLGLRLMQRHSVSELSLLPIVEGDPSPTIDAGSSLNDALAALVNSATGRVVVVAEKPESTPVGVATFELIVDALNKESAR